MESGELKISSGLKTGIAVLVFPSPGLGLGLGVCSLSLASYDKSFLLCFFHLSYSYCEMEVDEFNLEIVY